MIITKLDDKIFGAVIKCINYNPESNEATSPYKNIKAYNCVLNTTYPYFNYNVLVRFSIVFNIPVLGIVFRMK